MRLFLLILVSILSVDGVIAQTLSIQEAVRLTLENNFDIQIAINEVEIATNNKTPGNAGFLPSVDISLSRNSTSEDSDYEFFSGATSSNSGARSINLNAGISANWVLFDGMEMFARMERFKYEELLADTRKHLMIEQALLSVAQNYQNLLRSQETISFLEASMEISKERLDLEKNRLDIGVGSELDLYQAQIDYNEDVSRLRLQQIYHRQLIRDISTMLVQEIEDNTRFIALETTLPHYEDEQIVERVRSQNSEIKQVRIQTDISNERIREQQKNYFPEISLNLSYNYSELNADAGNLTFLNRKGITWGVTARWNIFNGFNTKREIENAKIESKNRQLELEQLNYTLIQRSKAIVQAYRESIFIFELETDNYRLADKTLEISKEKYNQGLISSFEFRESQQKWLNAQLRYITVKSDLYTEYFRLTYLMGDILKDNSY